MRAIRVPLFGMRCASCWEVIWDMQELGRQGPDKIGEV